MEQLQCPRCKAKAPRADWASRYGIITCGTCLHSGYVILPETIMADKDFPTLVRDLLVMEHGKSQEEADRLCRTHTQVMLNGIMSGLSFINVRATALAIIMWEADLMHGEKPVKEGGS